MSFIDEFQADLDCLPNVLQKKYALLRDLDKSLEDLKRQNGHRCEQEIYNIRRRNRPVSVLDTSFMRFSDEALDEQRHSIRIADEKVALAVQAYDLVDAHIQQLDQYLKKFNEEARYGTPASDGAPVSNSEGTTRPGRGQDWRVQQQLLLQTRLVWTWTYRLTRMNPLTASATKLAMEKWSHVTIRIAR